MVNSILIVMHTPGLKITAIIEQQLCTNHIVVYLLPLKAVKLEHRQVYQFAGNATEGLTL